MSEAVRLVPKQDLADEVRRIANTLSDDAQNAALRKCKELGYDPDKGNIPLEETLINLSQSRDLLLDAIERGKFTQIPLSVQYLLLRQTRQVSDSLTALVNGSDGILNLGDAVENLTASVWQFNLYNLSEKVLGFQQKMNQLKAQEVVIRQAHREAEDFAKTRKKADSLLEDVSNAATAGAEFVKKLEETVAESSALQAKVVELEQATAGLTIRVEQHDSTATQHAANAKIAAADIEAMANKAKALQVEIEATRSATGELQSNLQQLLTEGQKKIEASIGALAEDQEKLRATTTADIEALKESLKSEVHSLTADADGQMKAAITGLQEHETNLQKQIDILISETRDQATRSEAAHKSALETQVGQFAQQYEGLRSEVGEQITQRVTEYDAEFKRLTTELDTLEGRIRESIERATGYTLFHSFQKRQLDLAKSKNFWAWALATIVTISLGASAYLIYSLSATQEYNAAFYLKLAISLPLIYAIAFCSVQYSRERRLEEEYAFKSSISISLEPYQKLVAQLVEKDKPEERAKYTAFIIESINRVFTSPTGSIFDEPHKDKTSAEKVIKAVGDVIDPLVKAIKK